RAVTVHAQVEQFGRALGRAPDPEVVQHDARPAERHVPVVSLVQVIVQADNRTRGPIGPVPLDHLATVREPRPSIRFDEHTALVAVYVGSNVYDARNAATFFERCHRYSRSTRQWSPIINRVP